MNNASLKVFLTFLLILIWIGPAQGAGKTGRRCTASDLVGTWDLVALSTRLKVSNPKDPFFLPYQRFRFDASGHVKETGSEKPIASDKSALQEFESAVFTSRYDLDSKGILNITKLERTIPERCFCTVMLQDLPPSTLAKLSATKRVQAPKKGDVILTYVGKDSKPALTKTLRKTG